MSDHEKILQDGPWYASIAKAEGYDEPVIDLWSKSSDNRLTIYTDDVYADALPALRRLLGQVAVAVEVAGAPSGLFDPGTAWEYPETLEEHRMHLHRQARELGRLRGLIAKVEWANRTADEESAVCPWCEADNGVRKRNVQHEPDCPAFSAPGVVR